MSYHNALTVGQLIEIIKDLPKDTPVFCNDTDCGTFTFDKDSIVYHNDGLYDAKSLNGRYGTVSSEKEESDNDLSWVDHRGPILVFNP